MAEQDDIIKKIEDKLIESQKKWAKIISTLKDKLYSDIKNIVEIEAESISNIQILTDEITSYALKIARDMSRIKKLQKEKFEYYCVQYKIKTNASEKSKLIEADISTYTHKVNVYEIHVEYLKETKKNLDNIRWAIKNKLELYNQLGID